MKTKSVAVRKIVWSSTSILIISGGGDDTAAAGERDWKSLRLVCVVTRARLFSCVCACVFMLALARWHRPWGGRHTSKAYFVYAFVWPTYVHVFCLKQNGGRWYWPEVTIFLSLWNLLMLLLLLLFLLLFWFVFDYSINTNHVTFTSQDLNLYLSYVRVLLFIM